VPRPGHSDEVCEVEQFLGVPPGEDLLEGVGTGDEEQVRLGVLGPESRSVSVVYVGPLRSTSIRLTENCGLEAVAITVMR